jgi:hypothetical protein
VKRRTGRETLTERELQNAVIELAQLLKWRVAHFRPARTAQGWRTAVAGDGVGFPDLVLVRDRLIFVELKSAKGRLSPAQQCWLADLEHDAGQEVHIWRPCHWLDGTIEQILR